MLPALATSSIGSLPHTQLELALQQALLLDIPAAPQLPRRDAAEYMVPQALEGLHGLRADAEGNVELDLGDWRRGAATLDARLDPQHLVSLQELRVVVVAVRREGAVVGVHCCGNTEWGPVLGLGWDVVSIDARLSLEAVLAAGAAFESFQAAGGVLSLGIVPTDLSAPDDLDAGLRDARQRLRPEALGRCLLTPACCP